MLQSNQLGGVNSMLKKRISVSKKRQITIPIGYITVSALKELSAISRTMPLLSALRESTGEFDEQILADLISKAFRV